MERLYYEKVNEYLTKTYGEKFSPKERKTLATMGLVQKDYGEALDCTLTSITTLIWYYSDYKLEPQEIYNFVEKTAKNFLYNGEKWGTAFIVVKPILDICLNHFGLEKSKKQYLIKGCFGHDFEIIKRQLNLRHPVILSMKNDGRNYYKNHTVTVIGYILMVSDNFVIPMLQVFDNWVKQISYVDYNKISTISSINF